MEGVKNLENIFQTKVVISDLPVMSVGILICLYFFFLNARTWGNIFNSKPICLKIIFK